MPVVLLMTVTLFDPAATWFPVAEMFATRLVRPAPLICTRTPEIVKVLVTTGGLELMEQLRQEC